MNIFASYPCPVKSAKFLDDRRCIKMILESAQLLSNSIAFYNGPELAPYKLTHINHPCIIWVRDCAENYEWLFEHFLALCNEYTNRYNKIHKCQDYAYIFASYQPPKLKEFTSFVNCTTYKDLEDVHLAYRLYLQDKWNADKRQPTWYRSKDRLLVENLYG